MENFDLYKVITALKDGKIIVYPTDTLYGIGADIFNFKAIKKVFLIKNRPQNIPLSVAVHNIDAIKKLAFINKSAKILINTFLPGKLTLILKKKDIVPDIITGNRDNIAIRIPDNNVALSLISKFGPITATSANIHELETPYIIKDIKLQFKSKDIDVYIDHGYLRGQPSTIVDISYNKVNVVREGAIKKKNILDAIHNG